MAIHSHSEDALISESPALRMNWTAEEDPVRRSWHAKGQAKLCKRCWVECKQNLVNNAANCGLRGAALVFPPSCQSRLADPFALLRPTES